MDGHYLITLFKGISKENQDRIIANYWRIIQNSHMHENYKKFPLNKNIAVDFHTILERSSKAYENYRYIFAKDPKVRTEINVSEIIHACKILFEELKHEGKPLMLTMK